MAWRLFNTLTRSVETFAPLDRAGRKVGMYCCGPTVHDFPHIGNFRTFVFADLVRRFLEFEGYEVRFVMNITDVEDKIIARIQSARTSLADYTRRYETAFLDGLKTLGCRLPAELPHATQHVDSMIALIERLVQRGLAYRAADGSVYFSLEKYQAAGHQYGQLVRLNLDQMRPGERVSRDEYAKEAWGDFALWKARVPEDGEVFWPSPWGEGRPGWHIECSAMSMDRLGPSLDLHLGGEDLAFPHHEDEIAQSEGAGLQEPGARFVKYWLHVAHLMVEGQKMSKSLGNFFTLPELEAKGFGGREIRYLLLTAHYRELFNFTLDNLQGARSALARLDECVLKLRQLAGDRTAEPDPALLRGFTEALEDDLNVAQAWGVIFEWVRENNRALAVAQLGPDQAAAAVAAWERVDGVLGLQAGQEEEAPPELFSLVGQRQAARARKDYAAADRFRDELKQKGWAVEDTPGGPRLKRLIQQ